jgi:AmmeMemoRadiSam system protein A
MIPESERATLLAIARNAIAVSLGRASVAPAWVAMPDRLAAVFVSLHTRGALRGCIGHLDADRALADVVASCAVSAAGADPRSPPVTSGELEALEIEISVLGSFELVESLTEIEIARHGLMVESRWRRGLLLPQVAPQWGWSVAEFIACTCRKAGLAPDAWPAGDASLYRFEAEIVRDTTMRGGAS